MPSNNKKPFTLSPTLPSNTQRKIRRTAHRQWAEAEIYIAPQAAIRPAKAGGVYVQAWLYVAWPPQS